MGTQFWSENLNGGEKAILEDLGIRERMTLKKHIGITLIGVIRLRIGPRNGLL
jgi:hypothetical protein